MSRNVRVVSVGRPRRGPMRELEDDYLLRISRFAPIERVVVSASRRASPAERKREEAGLLRATFPERCVPIALDSRGEEFTSAEFGSRLARWRERGEVVFVVGGPDGFDPSFLESGLTSLSLGLMTLPHELAMVVLLEQLYRALADEAGHPYARH